jgi:copper(I)-binding protein
MTNNKVAYLLLALSVMAFKVVGCENLILEAGSIIRPPPGSQYAVGYFQIKNIGLTKAVVRNFSSTFFESISIHRTSLSHTTNLSIMRLVKDLSIAPEEVLIAEPGGIHLMIKLIKNSLHFNEHSINLNVSCENRTSSDMIFQVSQQDSTHSSHNH